MSSEIRRVRVVQSDGRGRISLRKFTENDLHQVDVSDDGVITLTPVIVIPAERAEQINSFLDDPSTGIRVTRKPRMGFTTPHKDDE